jgi:flagellar basal body P-ring protein FlgI
MTTDKPIVVEVDCTTGEQTSRPMTTEELANHLKMQEDFAAQQAEREEADAAKAAALDSANKKLAKLGLTADEIAALVG